MKTVLTSSVFQKIKNNTNLAFILLLLLLLVINLPYFADDVVPFHDTMYHLNIFHYFYSNLFFHGELAQWAPYACYGLDAGVYQDLGLQPGSVIVALWGLLTQTTDVLFLFKLIILFDQIVLLVGLYLLGCYLFSNKTTTVLTCIAGIGGLLWLTQSYWNLYIAYMIPLCLYFLLKGLDNCQGWRIWLSIWLLSISLFGNVAYFAPLYGLMVFTIFLVYFCKDRHLILIPFSLTPVTLLSAAAAMLTTGVYLIHVLRSVQFFTWYHLDRSLPKIPLDNFLTWGEDLIRSVTPIQFFSGMAVYHLPVVAYIGLLPLPFLFYAILKVRSIPFLSLLFATGVLIGLSFGGGLATVAYFFPAMSQFRHVGHIYGLIRILLVICAGFGIDLFLEKIKAKDISEKFRESIKPYPATLVLMAGTLLLLVDWTASRFFHNLSTPVTLNADRIALFFFLARLLVYGSSLWFLTIKVQTGTDAFPKMTTIVMMVSLLFDILSFQAVVQMESPAVSKDKLPSLAILNISPLEFVRQRSHAPDAFQKKGIDLLNRKPPFRDVKMEFIHNFLRLDAPYPRAQTLFFPEGVDKLIRLRGGKPGEVPTNDFLPNDPNLLAVLGCHAPKLRVVNRAKFVQTFWAAQIHVQHSPDIAACPVLRPIRTDSDFNSAVCPSLRIKSPNTRQTRAEFNPANLMDGDKTTFWEATGSKGMELLIEFEPSIKISKFGFFAGPYKESLNRMPTKWQLQGAVADGKWTLLDDFSDDRPWQSREQRIYELAHPGSYSRYRFVFNRTGESGIIRLHEMFLIPPVTVKGEADAHHGTDDVKIRRFSANQLEVLVKTSEHDSSWLTYADAWHPGWHATVNGNPVPVLEANLSFKAVALVPGKNLVKFIFSDPVSGLTAYAMIVIGGGCAIWIIWVFVAIVAGSENRMK